MNTWELLGIAPTQDIRAIKRAYSDRLKVTRPDDDALAYQQLREAYDWAQRYAKLHAAHIDRGLFESGDLIEPAELLSAEDVAVAVPPDTRHESPYSDAPSNLDAHAITLESLLKQCVDLVNGSSSADVVQGWPRLQALLEDLPIGEHNYASRSFAQFVVEQPDLPVEVMIALTRHFHWGLDFRVDQALGAKLAQAVFAQLNAADVFTVFRPERYTQHAWTLALAKLWDEKRRLWVRLLTAGLDCPTRKQILKARPSSMQALGASRDAVAATQAFVAMGGKLQGGFFALLVACALVFLYRPGHPNSSFAEVAGFGLGALLVYFFLYDVLRSNRNTLHNVRSGEVQIVAVWLPMVASFFILMDQRNTTLGGYSNHHRFLLAVGGVYLTIWLAALTDEDPWCELLLPTFGLLTFGVREYFPEINLALLISMAFAWTMAANLVMRGYPERVEWVYSQIIKMGLLKTTPLLLLGIRFFGIAWALIAVALLPILLFRMADKYRVLYSGTAIYVGVLLGNARDLEGKSYGLLTGVLAVVICIQVLQALSQNLANFGLKKARLRERI